MIPAWSHWSDKIVVEVRTFWELSVPYFLWNLDLCVPKKGIARPQSQFSHSCVCERSTVCIPTFVPPIFLQQNRQTRSGEYTLWRKLTGCSGPQPGCQWSNLSWPGIWFTSVGWIKPLANPEFSRDFWKLVFVPIPRSEISKKFYFPSPEYSKRLVVLVPRPEFSGNIPFPSLEVLRNSWHLQARKTASRSIRFTVLLITKLMSYHYTISSDW